MRREWWRDWRREQDPRWRIRKLRAALRDTYRQYEGVTLERNRRYVRGLDDLVNDCNAILMRLDPELTTYEHHLAVALDIARDREALVDDLILEAPRRPQCGCAFHVVQRQNPRKAYEAYLRSLEWHERVERITARSSGQCERCRGGRARDVHHRTYTNVFHEPLDDLWHICRPCHKELHAAALARWSA